MYDKVPTSMNFVEREKKVEKFWEENHIFEKSIDNRKKGETYTFYDGPPTANGKPHIGHVETRVIKDMIPRYQAMKGKMVPRKAGWDTHGLSWKLRRSWDWTARSRLSSMVWSRLSKNVRKASGSTRACGRISPTPLVSGPTWSIRTLLTRITSSSPSGGL